MFNSVTPMTTSAGQPTAAAKVGLGVYTCATCDSINVSTTVRGAGATTLWDASFWWPYIGMYLPPVANATSTWRSNTGGGEQKACSAHPESGGFNHGDRVSGITIATHLREMSENGITVPLSYFNLFEFGQNVVWPLPPVPAACRGGGERNANPTRCWTNSSVFLAAELSDAIYFENNATLQRVSVTRSLFSLSLSSLSLFSDLVCVCFPHFSLPSLLSLSLSLAHVHVAERNRTRSWSRFISIISRRASRTPFRAAWK